MRLYLAGSEPPTWHMALDGMSGLSFLVSYWFFTQNKDWSVLDFAEKRGIPLFLDSGAFSAFTLGARISLADYVSFIRREGHRFAAIASLDVIGDADASAENHAAMQKAGIPSIPCFHVREPWEALERMVAENDYIALGVAGYQKDRRKIMAWLAKAFQIRARVNPSCRVHGFALTSPVVMQSFPWHSVDSSTWLNGNRFGKAFFLDGNTFVQVHKGSRPELKARVKTLIPQRSQSTRAYWPTLRNNAEVMLQWTQSLTAARLNSSNTSPTSPLSAA